MRKKIMSFCFLATILWYVSCTNRSKHEQIDRTIKNFYDKGAFNGAILVAERGRIVYDTAMGSADFIKKKTFRYQRCILSGFFV